MPCSPTGQHEQARGITSKVVCQTVSFSLNSQHGQQENKYPRHYGTIPYIGVGPSDEVINSQNISCIIIDCIQKIHVKYI